MIRREKSTLYELNAKGVNLWQATLSAGKDNAGSRTTEEKLEKIARKLRAVDDLYEALENALALLEHNSEQIDSEWGMGRSLYEIESDGDLEPEITQARAALAKARGEV